MKDLSVITPTRIGLRAYDTAIGFRNLDERGAMITDFSPTHTVGMAAVLAGAIKGKDVIRDARSLKRIAAEVLKINPYAFDKVVLELAELEIVRGIQRKAGEIVSFAESVPLLYDDIHERLGTRWFDMQPSELEAQFLTTLDKLAQTPLLTDTLLTEIGTDAKAERKLRLIGEGAELIRYYPLRDGTEVAVSPLHAFEHPDKLVTLFERYEADRVREAFVQVREQPGFPVLMDHSYPIMEDMIRLGLIPAPTVVGADRQERAFAIMLYGLDPIYLSSKKQILERALAIIACVRCGEISGGITRIRVPDRLLAALMDPGRNYTLNGHSSASRQYAPLIRMGVITVVPMGDLLGVRLIPTQDNLEATNLARNLLQRKGDAVPERGSERDFTLKSSIRAVLWAQEYSTRLDVLLAYNKDVQGKNGAGKAGLTDLDVLGLRLDPGFRVHSVVADCKTTSGQVPERLFWLSGVGKFFGSDANLLVRSHPLPDHAPPLAKSLDIALVGPDDLSILMNTYVSPLYRAQPQVWQDYFSPALLSEALARL